MQDQEMLRAKLELKLSAYATMLQSVIWLLQFLKEFRMLKV